jgi:hypothetical protein
VQDRAWSAEVQTIAREVERVLAEGWVPPLVLPDCGTDTLLISAVVAIASINLLYDRLVSSSYSVPQARRLLRRYEVLRDFVLSTPAQGSSGAQAKAHIHLDRSAP